MAKKSLNGHLVSSKVTRVCDVSQLLLQALHHVGHLKHVINERCTRKLERQEIPPHCNFLQGILLTHEI